MDEQRKRVYGYRQRILDGDNCRDLILEMIDEQIDAAMQTFLDAGLRRRVVRRGGRQPAERRARGPRLPQRELRRRRRGWRPRRRSRKAESQVLDAIDENLPEDAEDESEWNWEALAHWANTRLGTNYRDRDLKKIGRDQLDEQLIADARDGDRQGRPGELRALPGAGLRREDGVRLAAGQVRRRARRRARWRRCEPKEFIRIAHERAAAAYDERESEFPVLAGLYRFTARDRAGQKQGFDREELVDWARGGSASSCRSTTCATSSATKSARCCWSTAARTTPRPTRWPPRPQERVDALFSDAGAEVTLGQATGHNGKLDDLTAWLRESLPVRPDGRRSGAARPQGGAAARRAAGRGPLPPRDAQAGAAAAPADPRPGAGKSTC